MNAAAVGHGGRARLGRGWGPGLATVLVAVLALAACGDPIVILGDQPGIMRVVLGVAPDLDPDQATPATREQLTYPQGVAVDDDGVLYVADQRTQRILAVYSDGDVETVVDHGSCGGDLCMERPEGIALDRTGGLVVADAQAGRVFRVTLATGAVTLVAGQPGGATPSPGATATEVGLEVPSGVAVADDGRVFFSDRDAHRVWVVGRDGILEPAAGTGNRGSSGDGGPAVEGELFLPGALSIAQGQLYIADRGNHKIRAVDLNSGVIGTVAGNGEPAFGGDNGRATQASLRFPDGVAVTPDGVTMFIADTGNNRIRSVNLGTGIIQSFAGTGDPDFTGGGIAAGDTGLDGPTGIAVASQSLLFISDTGHQLVWRTPVRF